MLKLQIHLEKLQSMQKKYYFWHENSYWTYHIALPAEKLLLKRQIERHKRGNEQLNLWGLSCNLSCGHHQTVDSKTILTHPIHIRYFCRLYMLDLSANTYSSEILSKLFKITI